MPFRLKSKFQFQELLPVGWPHNPTVRRSGCCDLSDFEKGDFEKGDFEVRDFELPEFVLPPSAVKTPVVKKFGGAFPSGS